MQENKMDLITEGIKKAEKIKSLFSLYENENPEDFCENKYMMLAKVSLIAAIKWLKENLSFDVEDIPNFDVVANGQYDDIYADVYGMSGDMIWLSGIMLKYASSWNATGTGDICNMLEDLGKEEVEKIVLENSGVLKNHPMFKTMVHELMENCDCETFFVMSIESMTNVRIPAFAKKFQKNRHLFTEDEQQAASLLLEVMLNDENPLYNLVYAHVVNGQTEGMLVKTFVSFEYGDSGECVLDYLYNPGAGMEMILLDMLMDQMELKYPEIFQNREENLPGKEIVNGRNKNTAGRNGIGEKML